MDISLFNLLKQQWNFLVVCFYYYYQMCSFTVDIGPFAHIVHSYLVLEVISLRKIEPQ